MQSSQTRKCFHMFSSAPRAPGRAPDCAIQKSHTRGPCNCKNLCFLRIWKVAPFLLISRLIHSSQREACWEVHWKRSHLDLRPSKPESHTVLMHTKLCPFLCVSLSQIFIPFAEGTSFLCWIRGLYHALLQGTICFTVPVIVKRFVRRCSRYRLQHVRKNYRTPDAMLTLYSMKLGVRLTSGGITATLFKRSVSFIIWHIWGKCWCFCLGLTLILPWHCQYKRLQTVVLDKTRRSFPCFVKNMDHLLSK